VYWGLTELPSLTLPISVGLNADGQMTTAGVPKGGALWLGNDSSALPATATDISGSMLGTVSAAVSGVAFDGTNLWFSDAFGNLTNAPAFFIRMRALRNVEGAERYYRSKTIALWM